MKLAVSYHEKSSRTQNNKVSIKKNEPEYRANEYPWTSTNADTTAS